MNSFTKLYFGGNSFSSSLDFAVSDRFEDRINDYLDTNLTDEDHLDSLLDTFRHSSIFQSTISMMARSESHFSGLTDLSQQGSQLIYPENIEDSLNEIHTSILQFFSSNRISPSTINDTKSMKNDTTDASIDMKTLEELALKTIPKLEDIPFHLLETSLLWPKIQLCCCFCIQNIHDTQNMNRLLQLIEKWVMQNYLPLEAWLPLLSTISQSLGTLNEVGIKKIILWIKFANHIHISSNRFSKDQLYAAVDSLFQVFKCNHHHYRQGNEDKLKNKFNCEQQANVMKLFEAVDPDFNWLLSWLCSLRTRRILYSVFEEFSLFPKVEPLDESRNLGSTELDLKNHSEHKTPFSNSKFLLMWLHCSPKELVKKVPQRVFSTLIELLIKNHHHQNLNETTMKVDVLSGFQSMLVNVCSETRVFAIIRDELVELYTRKTDYSKYLIVKNIIENVVGGINKHGVEDLAYNLFIQLLDLSSTVKTLENSKNLKVSISEIFKEFPQFLLHGKIIDFLLKDCISSHPDVHENFKSWIQSSFIPFSKLTTDSKNHENVVLLKQFFWNLISTPNGCLFIWSLYPFELENKNEETHALTNWIMNELCFQQQVVVRKKSTILSLYRLIFTSHPNNNLFKTEEFTDWIFEQLSAGILCLNSNDDNFTLWLMILDSHIYMNARLFSQETINMVIQRYVSSRNSFDEFMGFTLLSTQKIRSTLQNDTGFCNSDKKKLLSLYEKRLDWLQSHFGVVEWVHVNRLFYPSWMLATDQLFIHE